MANVIKFDMKNTPASLDEMFVRVTDTDRNELFSGTQSITDSAIELNLGALGSVGQSVLVHGDNFNGSNASTFKAFSGYSLIEAGETQAFLSGEYLSVIATGDSIADLGSTENQFLYSLNTKGWPANSFAQSNQLFKMLPDSGIAGNTTQMLLDRLQTDVIDTGAQVAVIMIGTNDVHAQIDENITIANMQSIVDQLVAAGMKAILTPITYRGDNHPIYTNKIDTINAAYANIAANNDNAAISGTFDEFNALAIDPVRWDEVTIDKLHPNSSGAYLMGKVISKALNDNLESYYPISSSQLVLNSELLGTGGSINLGATGQAPDSFVVFYAQPISGVGVERIGDSLILRAGDGSTGGRDDAKIFQNISISNLLATDEFIAKATVSVDKQILSEILSMSVSLNPNQGRTYNFQFNGEDANAVFQEDYASFVMRTIPIALDPSATSVEVSVTLKSRGNQDVEIKIHDLELIKIP